MTYSELGRELRVSELQAQTVVILGKEGQPHMISTWVKDVTAHSVSFLAGELQMLLILRRDGEALYDDTARMHVYQYLGGDEPTSGAAQA
jgi:hypothetical protein